MDDKTKILDVLTAQDDFLLTAHINPDGDAFGSCVALGFVCKKLGKKFYLYNESGLPERFNWLSLPAPFEDNLPASKPQWIIVLDSGNKERVGDKLLPWLKEVPVINIDHHADNTCFGRLNLIRPKAASVGEIIAELACDLDVKLTPPLSEAIYLTLVTDTGSFAYGNTTSFTHNLVAKMLDLGLDSSKIHALLDKNWTKNKIQLMILALSTLETFFEDKVGLICITQKMFRQTKTNKEDCEGFINYVRGLKTTMVAISLREELNKTVKFSLRSYGDVDVQQIAAALGGGGHKNAAGGTINGSIEEAKTKLLTQVKNALCL